MQTDNGAFVFLSRQAQTVGRLSDVCHFGFGITAFICCGCVRNEKHIEQLKEEERRRERTREEDGEG